MSHLPTHFPRRSLSSTFLAPDVTEVTRLADAEVWFDTRARASALSLANEYRVTLTRSGCARVRRGRRVFDVHPGVVTVMVPGDLCVATPFGDAPWSAMTLHLAGDALTTERPLDQGGPPQRDPRLEEAEGVVAAFLDLASNDESNLGNPLRQFLGALATTDRSIDPSAAPDESHVIVKRTTRLLRERFADALSLDDIGDAVGVNKWSVLKTFTSYVGVSPLWYQRLLRVAAARTLLARGGSFGDVAYRCGFCDQSHLNRWFRRLLGVTPGQYVCALGARPSRLCVAPTKQARFFSQGPCT